MNSENRKGSRSPLPKRRKKRIEDIKDQLYETQILGSSVSE